MPPEKLARIQTHLDRETLGVPPPDHVIDCVLPGLVQDAFESPSSVMAGTPPSPCPVPTGNHALDGDVSPNDTSRSPRAPGVSGTEARAPGGEPPVCLFGPGGEFQTPWPHD